MHECAPWVECMQEAANSRTVATHVKKKKKSRRFTYSWKRLLEILSKQGGVKVK